MLKPSKKIIEGVIPYDKCRAKTCADGSPGTRVVDHGIYAGKVAEQLFSKSTLQAGQKYSKIMKAPTPIMLKSAQRQYKLTINYR